MTLFIAEKPELARAIALGLSGELKTKERTHIIKGDSIITHAFGHILELAQPEVYNKSYEKWNLNDLPLNLPRPFKRVAKKEAKTQLNIIINFIKDAQVKEIMHCGDADEEGQILIDEILYYAKNTKPVYRVLINDLTPKAIAKAVSERKPNEDFKYLSESGFARSEADFLVGINLTRLYTLLSNTQGVLSVGRVQTPILGLIVHRELDFKNHKAQTYFNIHANFLLNHHIITAPLKLKKDEIISDEARAKEIKEYCEGKEFNLSMTKELKKEHPPLPFNLLELQALASKLYGLSPDKTLKITQSLRENHKAISYNRSDCQYLPESLHEEAPLIIETLKANFKEDIGQNNAKASIKSKAFDDSKLSAHYGIIPLQTRLDLMRLNPDELKLYTLISQRFLMQFYPPCEYESFHFSFTLNDLAFESTKRKDINLGFKEEFKESRENLEKEGLDYNDFLALNSSFCKSLEYQKEQTKPLPLYTMTTLLKDLNKVSKYVKDERIKKLLIEKDKDKKGESGGIGTPATRSTHIKTLIDRAYIEVSKDKAQKIKATPKGIALIQSLPSILTQPDMTALWYEKQKEIQKGSLSREEFLKEIDAFILSLMTENKGKIMDIKDAKEQIKCPKCNEGHLREIDGKYGKFFSCSRYKEGCEFKAKSLNGKPDLNPKEAQKSEHQCPKCQKGFLIRRESKNKKGSFWYGCSEFKNDCKFICYEKEGKPDIKI